MKRLGYRIGRKILLDTAILLFGAILGFGALWLVHLLPTEPMEQNVRWSMPMIRNEFENGMLIPGFEGTLVGNFTDCLMLHYSIYRNQEHTGLEQMLHMYRSESSKIGGWQPGWSLYDYIMCVPQPREEEYGRYWHGYLVVLKPLLMLTTVNGIRMIFSVVQVMLVCLILVSYTRRKAYGLAAAFIFALPFLYFSSMYMSLSLSICFYLMGISMLVQLYADKELENRQWYGFFFLMIGMATSYFDFLTYPLVTLGFPLCQYLYLNRSSWQNRFCRLLCFSTDWCVGYAGLWAVKWIAVDVLADGNVIKNAMETITQRTGRIENKNILEGFIYVVGKNITPYKNIAFFVLCPVIGAWLVFKIRKSIKKDFGRDIVKKSSVFLLLAAYPFIWFFFTQNHSGEHWMFTCKILAISVFSCISGISYALSEPDIQQDRKA